MLDKIISHVHGLPCNPILSVEVNSMLSVFASSAVNRA